MILIISGGRDYQFTPEDIAKLDTLLPEITAIYEGGATGADECGRRWAKSRGFEPRTFRAKWDDISHPKAVIRKRRDGSLYNAAAGPIRNGEMIAAGADAVALFPGGRGTADMERQARAAGLKIYDFRDAGRKLAQPDAPGVECARALENSHCRRD